MAGDREKALDVALAQIEKQFGKGSVMRLGDETRAPLEVIPTGSPPTPPRTTPPTPCAASWVPCRPTWRRRTSH